MSLSKILKMIQELSESIDSTCTRPAARTQEDVDLWHSDHEEYLKVKLLGVKPLAHDLKDKAEEVLLQSQQFYSGVVELWHHNYFKSYSMLKLVQQGRIDEARQVKTHDYSTLSYKEKLTNLFNTFDDVIDAFY